MNLPIPILMPNPITEGLKKIELSDAISSGRVLMLDVVKSLPWYGTYCMPARAWIKMSASLVIRIGHDLPLARGSSCSAGPAAPAGSRTSCAW